VPQEWSNDEERCEHAGMPPERTLTTKPPLARQMLERAFDAGVPAAWVTGDSVYGDNRRLRVWLEEQAHAHVLAVSGKEYVWRAGRQQQVKTIVATLAAAGWSRLSAGDGAKGPRWYDWRGLPLAAPLQPHWCRWLLVRVAAHKRNHLDPQTSLDSAHILCKYAVLQAHMLCKRAHILCKQLTNIRSGSHALHISQPDDLNRSPHGSRWLSGGH
jgi:hypothetical protein